MATVASAAVATLTPQLTPAQLTQVKKLYAKDHHGAGLPSDAGLLPYSTEFAKLVARCKIRSDDLASSTIYLAGEVTALGGPPMTTLAMLQAFTHRITGSARRNCWDTFFDVENRLAAKVASALIENRNEVTSLYVFDRNGANPQSDVDLLPYSNAFAAILVSCRISAEDATNLLLELAQKASELGARHVSTLMMMNAVTRRIDWKGKQDCTDTFNTAEGHMENGGP
jgi:hypothetical protein